MMMMMMMRSGYKQDLGICFNSPGLDVYLIPV